MDIQNLSGVFDEEGTPISDGQTVRVNSEHVGDIHITGPGQFTVEGWPEDQIIEVLEIVNEPTLDIDEIHPMIKE